MIVAIDGPSGAGKSTTARAVADHMGYLYLDTGAMYRAVALAFVKAGLKPTEDNAQQLLDSGLLDYVDMSDGNRVSLNGQDVSEKIRTSEVTEHVSAVSALKTIRSALVRLQRRLANRHVASGGGVVLDGRDIGTVVFPGANVKVFLTASLEERAKRRYEERTAKGDIVNLEEVKKDLHRRDVLDSTRKVAPLQKAEDAFELDTTKLDFEEQLSLILKLIMNRNKIPPLD